MVEGADEAVDTVGSAAVDVDGVFLVVVLLRAICEALGAVVAAGDGLDELRAVRVTDGSGEGADSVGAVEIACEAAWVVACVRAMAFDAASIAGFVCILGVCDGPTSAAIVAASGRGVARVRWLDTGVGV